MEMQSSSNKTKGQVDDPKNLKREPKKEKIYDDDYCLGMWSQPDILDLSSLTS
jgi:hypothetical protein